MLGTLFAGGLTLSSPAYAYLDPATGSIALQALIGAIATWALYSKMLASRARSFFMRMAGKGRKTEDSE